MGNLTSKLAVSSSECVRSLFQSYHQTCLYRSCLSSHTLTSELKSRTDQLLLKCSVYYKVLVNCSLDCSLVFYIDTWHQYQGVL